MPSHRSMAFDSNIMLRTSCSSPSQPRAEDLPQPGSRPRGPPKPRPLLRPSGPGDRRTPRMPQQSQAKPPTPAIPAWNLKVAPASFPTTASPWTGTRHHQQGPRLFQRPSIRNRASFLRTRADDPPDERGQFLPVHPGALPLRLCAHVTADHHLRGSAYLAIPASRLDDDVRGALEADAVPPSFSRRMLTWLVTLVSPGCRNRGPRARARDWRTRNSGAHRSHQAIILRPKPRPRAGGVVDARDTPALDASIEVSDTPEEHPIGHGFIHYKGHSREPWRRPRALLSGALRGSLAAWTSKRLTELG